MKVIVLGAGVVGVTSAYYLARAGAQVVVVDRQAQAAQETSFGNAGQVSPGYSTPWAAPGIPLKAIKWMFQKHAPLAVRLDGSLFQLQWIAHMLRNCNSASYAVNKERMTRVAEYSRDCLRQLRADTGIQYENRSAGTLQLFRTAAQVEAVQRDIQVLQECGVPHELLTPDQLSRVEPGLAHATGRLTGGLHLPNDETGDCHLFTQALVKECERLGVEFRFGHTIEQLEFAGDAITGVRVAHVMQDGQPSQAVHLKPTTAERLTADRFVLALGSYSRQLLAPLQLRIPVYPVKGYSLTVPLLDESLAPQSTVLDETYKIAVTRFDQRIRVGGMAELGGFDLRLDPRRRETLAMVVGDLFPGGDIPNASFWTGLRPMTPDGTPIIGATPYRNLFLNTGHGTLGWTMSCGSGKVLADLLMGHTPDISTDGLAMSRYRQRSEVNLPPVAVGAA